MDIEDQIAKLVENDVNVVITSAKLPSGYFTYPRSKGGPTHPALKDRDWLGQAVEACQRQNIKIVPYVGVMDDIYMARTHPNWAQICSDGTKLQFGSEDLWVCVNTRTLLRRW